MAGREQVKVALVAGKIPSPILQPDGGNTGAALAFEGIVRGVENDQPIVALYYEAYEEMAAKELMALCLEALNLYDLQKIECWHRINEVSVDETSLQIVMHSRHRGSGLEAMTWLIREIKNRVPIWKWGITADGKRFPSKRSEQQKNKILTKDIA